MKCSVLRNIWIVVSILSIAGLGVSAGLSYAYIEQKHLHHLFGFYPTLFLALAIFSVCAFIYSIYASFSPTKTKYYTLGFLNLLIISCFLVIGFYMLVRWDAYVRSLDQKWTTLFDKFATDPIQVSLDCCGFETPDDRTRSTANCIDISEAVSCRERLLVDFKIKVRIATILAICSGIVLGLNYIPLFKLASQQKNFDTMPELDTLISDSRL